MPSRLKELIQQEMASRYRDVDNMIFVGYRGLKGGEVAAFREELRKEGVHLKVVRNRITVRALGELGRPGEIDALFDGPTAIMDGEDPVAMAKAAVAFAGRSKLLDVRGGLVEGEILTADEVIRLSKMPSRVEMLGIIAGTAAAVGGRVAGALLGPGGRVAGAVRSKGESESEDASGSPEPQAA
jgi:large subunit ribosomal protein L10